METQSVWAAPAPETRRELLQWCSASAPADAAKHRTSSTWCYVSSRCMNLLKNTGLRNRAVKNSCFTCVTSAEWSQGQKKKKEVIICNIWCLSILLQGGAEWEQTIRPASKVFILIYCFVSLNICLSVCLHELSERLLWSVLLSVFPLQHTHKAVTPAIKVFCFGGFFRHPPTLLGHLRWGHSSLMRAERSTLRGALVTADGDQRRTRTGTGSAWGCERGFSWKARRTKIKPEGDGEGWKK